MMTDAPRNASVAELVVENRKTGIRPR